MSASPRWLKIGLWIVAGLAGVGILLVGALALGVWAASEPLPDGTPGPEAEALAESLRDSVDHEAWDRTGAVAWTFAGMNSHLWDKRRMLDRYQSGGLTVWIDLDTRTGRAERDGRELTGAELDGALQTAWASWANDSFWLNPVVKVFDEGTTRSVVRLDDGRDALLVTYSSGGVTPGDSYLWVPGPDGRPERWEMWVQVLPIGGLDVTWDDWVQLDTGAWVSTSHTMQIGLTTEITDLRAASDVLALEGADPFAELVER